MLTENNYRFSFTAASLRTNDLVEVARWEDFSDTKDLILKIGNGKSATGRRIMRELRNWLGSLNEHQKQVLQNGSFKAQNEVAFLAVCKYFKFIREFLIEVVREKLLVFDYELTEGDYLSFYRRKAETHPEVDQLTEITQNKIRQVVFRMLEQAGIIDSIKTKIIQPQILETDTLSAIIEDNSEWLKVFMYSELDIKRLEEAYE